MTTTPPVPGVDLVSFSNGDPLPSEVAPASESIVLDDEPTSNIALNPSSSVAPTPSCDIDVALVHNFSLPSINRHSILHCNMQGKTWRLQGYACRRFTCPCFEALIDRTKLNPSEVSDIVVGTVLAPNSQRGIECRMAAYYVGFPDTVPIRTVNRKCSSGLQAVANVAACIKAGFYDIGIGAGLESMTIDKVIPGVPKVNPKTKAFVQARDCLLPMGMTSENVAERYGVTRLEQV
ncbi:hypothetical protein HRI_003914700 [Hibiscus trionum]|uniref:Thiolase N-terminal domain-containing protein n=1 Tax=Hibiscus trionum TaxID=183268 RepID=A0A9W7MJX4_HIBTR|nr:hypothetical protein HRI_003914700 [Hibiscus trionum]